MPARRMLPMIRWSEFGPSLVRPMRYAASRAIARRDYTLSSVALEKEILLTATKIHALAPFSKSEQFPRVLDTSNFTAREIVAEHLLRKEVDLFPLVRYRFADVALIKGSLFIDDKIRLELRSTYHKRGTLERLSIGMGKVEREAFGVLASGVAGSSWFGHWLEDELPLLMAVNQIGPTVSHARLLYGHEPSYLRKLGLEPPRQFDAAVFDDFVIVDEFGQNADKVKRFAQMRKQLKAEAGGSGRIYLRRGKTGALRQLEREDDLIDKLLNEGFSIVDIEHASLDELARTCAGASIIIGIEGSHLAHALFLAPEACLFVILNPPYQVHTTVADLAPFMGLHAAMFVCESCANSTTSFKLNVNELLSFIDDAADFALQRRGPATAFLGALLEAEPINWG